MKKNQILEEQLYQLFDEGVLYPGNLISCSSFEQLEKMSFAEKTEKGYQLTRRGLAYAVKNRLRFLFIRKCLRFKNKFKFYQIKHRLYLFFEIKK